MQTTEETIIEIRSLTKIYKNGKKEFKALNNVSLKIKKGDFVALMGPSGSGKSTLMNVIGCLDHLTSGEIYLDGEKISNKTNEQLTEIRGTKIGFIFQTFNLIPTLTALENVALPMVMIGFPKAIREKKAMELLKKMGLENWAMRLPSELSGGQQQRVAIARALVNDTSIILADEPTGNLDSKTGEQVMQILSEINKEGKTILLVTHDQSLTKYTNRVFSLLDGEISEDENKIIKSTIRTITKEDKLPENKPDPFAHDPFNQENRLSQKEPKIEEICIHDLEKKNKTEYIAKALEPKMSEQPQKTDSNEWFSGTGNVRNKINELIEKNEIPKKDKWLEGEGDIQSKVNKALDRNSKNKSKHLLSSGADEVKSI